MSNTHQKVHPRNARRSWSNPAADEKWPLGDPQLERPWPFQLPTGAEIYVNRSPVWTCLTTVESFLLSRVEPGSPSGHFWWTELNVISICSLHRVFTPWALWAHAAEFSQNVPARLYLPRASPAHCLPSPKDTPILLISSTCNFTNHSHMVFIFLPAMFAKVFCKVSLCTF